MTSSIRTRVAILATLVALAAIGIASYLRIAPAAGTIEVGHIHFSPRLQHTPAATEAMYLMMRRAFELGYRRYEWKCDALNAPSRRAAQRLGFSYEGIFRQAIVTKGRNRDTAWYSITDGEWQAVRLAFEQWLAPANFDADGRQRRSLPALRQGLLVVVRFAHLGTGFVEGVGPMVYREGMGWWYRTYVPNETQLAQLEA